MRRSIRSFNILPTGNPQAFELLKNGLFKFPPPGQKFCSNPLRIFFLLKPKSPTVLHIDQALKPNSGQDRNIGDLCMTESLKEGKIMKENQS